MTVNNTVSAVAGVMVMASFLLGTYVDVAWFYLGAFVGFMLFQSAFTGFCPMANVVKKLGAK